MFKNALTCAVLVLVLCLPVCAQNTYGGWDGIKGKKTGFFHVEKMGKRWWCIDPSGAVFYAVGTDHINYDVHWCETLGYAPYARNIRTRYNNDESAWAKSSTDRLKSWGFNLLGANNSPSTRGRGMAYTEFMSMGANFAGQESIVEKVYWTGFPDVFSPNFIALCEKMASEKCAPLKDDPWLFGWFIDNELEWFGKTGSPTGLAEEAIKRPAVSYAKRALVELLRSKYNTAESLNATWGTALTGWDDALKSTDWKEKNAPKVTADKTAYIKLCADRYFDITTKAIRKADPNHMILGCRFAGNAPDVVDVAGKYCDIVTINFYGSVDLDKLTAPGLVEAMTRYHKQSGRPLMVTEWSFPALDAGLPCTGGAGMRVRTQADKARAFEVYQTSFFSMPFFVGSDYFMWVDEPAQGIAKTFPENSNYGLVDLNDDPWPVFTRNVSRVNKKVYRIHRAMTSDIAILQVKASNGIEIIAGNSGTVDCAALMAVKIDGREYAKKVSVIAGRKTAVRFDCELGPGGHYVDAILDPDGGLDETNRGNNHYSGFVYLRGKSPVSKGVAVLVAAPASRHSVITIPLSKITSKRLPASIRLLNSTANSTPANIFDLDNSGSITPADELVFEVDTVKGLADTFYIDLSSSKSKQGNAKLIESTPVSSLNFELGGMRITKNSQSKAGIDSIQVGGVEIGSFTTLIQETAGKPFFEYPDSVSDMLLWDGGNIKQVQMTFLRTPETKSSTGPYSYKAVYMLGFGYGKNQFTSRFISVTNTDSQPWTLSRYFHYPQSNIGGNGEGDKVMGLSAWTDTTSGGCYGVYAPPSAGMSVIFWNDENGGQHPDVFKTLDMTLKPNATYSEQPEPVYMFCDINKDSAAAYRDFEREMQEMPRWQTFGL